MIRMKEKPFYLKEEDIQWVEDVRGKMTVEEKVGQLFCLHGDTNDKKELEKILNTYHPGLCCSNDLKIATATLLF